MKLTVTEGYKPVTYDVTLDFELDISDADSLNAAKKVSTWNVYDTTSNKLLSSAASIDVAMIKAGNALNDAAFMQRLREEEIAQDKRRAEEEAKRLAKRLAKATKK